MLGGRSVAPGGGGGTDAVARLGEIVVTHDDATGTLQLQGPVLFAFRVDCPQAFDDGAVQILEGGEDITALANAWTADLPAGGLGSEAGVHNTIPIGASGQLVPTGDGLISVALTGAPTTGELTIEVYTPFTVTIEPAQ